MSPLTLAASKIIQLLPRRRVSQMMGGLAEASFPKPITSAVIGAYRRAYNVEMSECAETPGYRSFDDFFTRELRAGARPIDADPSVLVSPSDGRLVSAGRVEASRTFLVKGSRYSAEDLLGDRKEAARYEGGAACVIYLSPRDYHRVHTPTGGTLVEVRSMPGDYYPVNDLGVQMVPKLFAVNRRVALVIDSNERFGRVTLVMVAAMVVGRITVSGIEAADAPLGTHTIGRKLERGDEVGIFHLGSTVVMFLERGAFGHYLVPEGESVRMGSRFVSRDHAEAP